MNVIKEMKIEFSEPISRALNDLKFTELTAVQEQSIPVIRNGDDLVAQSRTGTGKTAAFAIPILERIDVSRPVVQALILTPTRELALQVGTDIQNLGKYTKSRVLIAYGGTGLEDQVRQLNSRNVQIVVGTPGRIMDLMSRGSLDISKLSFFVLDEADIMLDMGFVRDVEKIISHAPNKKQVLMFCVDFPETVFNLAKRHMRYPKHVKLVSTDKSATGVVQSFYPVRREEKLGVLVFLLRELKPSKALIFCKTKRQVTRLTRQLDYNGIKAAGLQGDMTQPQRTRTMQAFKDDTISMLVATDVAARGIQVDHISHIFNYELPHDINYYIHRIGRTGRMYEVGEAITLCDSDESRDLYLIEQMIGKTIEQKELPSHIPAPLMPPRGSSFGGNKSRRFGQSGRFQRRR